MSIGIFKFRHVIRRECERTDLSTAVTGGDSSYYENVKYFVWTQAAWRIDFIHITTPVCLSVCLAAFSVFLPSCPPSFLPPFFLYPSVNPGYKELNHGPYLNSIPALIVSHRSLQTLMESQADIRILDVVPPPPRRVGVFPLGCHIKQVCVGVCVRSCQSALQPARSRHINPMQ